VYQLKLKDAISCSEFWRVKIHSARLWIIVVDLPCPLQTSILFILLRIAYFICLTIYLFYVVTSNNLYHVKYLFCGIIFYFIPPIINVFLLHWWKWNVYDVILFGCSREIKYLSYSSFYYKCIYVAIRAGEPLVFGHLERSQSRSR